MTTWPRSVKALSRRAGAKAVSFSARDSIFTVRWAPFSVAQSLSSLILPRWRRRPSPAARRSRDLALASQVIHIDTLAARDNRTRPVPDEASDRAPAGGGLAPSPSRFTREDVFSVSVFPPHSNQAKGWRRLSRWIRRFARPFQPTSFGRGLRNGRIRRSIIPPRLMRPEGSGPDKSAQTAGK